MCVCETASVSSYWFRVPGEKQIPKGKKQEKEERVGNQGGASGGTNI